MPTLRTMHSEYTAMEIRACPLESAKAYFFDTATWGSFCDVTLTLKQARQSDRGTWIKIDDYPCRQAFRHFMKLLNRAVYGAAFVDTANVFASYPYLKKARSAPAPYDHGSVARRVDGLCN